MTDRIDGELHQHAKADPQVKVLRTLPGVGEFTALVMVAEIGDITRFPSARKLASRAGLTPTVRGSDLHVRHGHISKQGSVWLRWAMRPTRLTAADAAIRRLAATMADQDGLATADRFCTYVHEAIRYAYGATSVATTAAEALAGGQGVCQDAAHVMIALCRAIGMPSRHVPPARRGRHPRLGGSYRRRR